MAPHWWTLAKRDTNAASARLGHTLAWTRSPRMPGVAPSFVGTCRDCGATATIRNGHTTCLTVRDARTDSCSGPGTDVLADIEQQRSTELFAEAVDAYVQALEDAGVAFEPPKLPFRNPLAPAHQCGLMSRDGYTCTRNLNKRGTHNGNEWGGPEGHVGSHPDDEFTRGFGDDDLLLA